MKKLLVSLALLLIVGCIWWGQIPSPFLTREEWARACLPQIEVMVDASEVLADLFTYPMAAGASRENQVDYQVSRLREANAALREIVPPEECREVHEIMLAAMDDWIHGSEYGLEGARQGDDALIAKADKYVRSGAAKINFATRMLEEMRETR